MKSRLALLGLLVVAAAPLAAQGGGRGMGGMNIEQMTTMYALTADQVAKATDLKKAYDASTAGVQAWMLKLREANPDNPAAMREAPGFADSLAKTTAARQAFDTEFKKILTGAQVVKFDSVQAARAARMRPQG